MLRYVKILFVPLLVLALLTACTEQSDGPLNAESRPEANADQPPASLPGTAPEESTPPEVPPPARLPEGVTPTHYTLHLTIDPGQTHFSGVVSIDVDLAEASSKLWLHGTDLEVSSAKAVTTDGQNITLSWSQATPYGVARLESNSVIPAGKIALVVEYKAPFNTNLEGLYKVTKGEDDYAFTQFEATSARLSFPSFDEPAFKVPFDISLTVPESSVGITNSPQVSESTDTEGMKTLVFATTKPLPTYLIAFAVGPFDVVEWEPIPNNAWRDTPLPLRGFTTRGKGDEIHFALKHTADIVEAMEEYFDTPYPYAKLDIIAVPDFSAGAMENAGAITYREQLILLDEDAPVSQKRGYFVTHAHELAHQWFGNLVTPVWWDDIWLNESFATWNSYIVLDSMYPDQKYREALQYRASRVMRNDSLASARQIREPITKHEDIGSAFNGITYRKGGGVLSMFESFLGTDNFRRGIRQYMKTFAFGNTTAEDFIGAIADANPQIDGEDLRSAFGSYIEQPGLPVINSSLSCDGNTAKVKFNQQRYLPIGSKGSKDQSWIVPVCVSTIDGEQRSSQCFLLKDKAQEITLNNERCPQAVLPNSGGNSYYRWSLPPEQWLSLLEVFDQLTVNEQISVANSLGAAVNDGSISLSDYLAAIPAITQSNSWRVAMSPRQDLYKIKDFVANEEEALILEERLRQWYRPQLDRLRALPSRESDEDQFLALATSTLALGGQDQAVRAELSESGKRYAGFQSDEQLHPEVIDPNLRLITLIVAVEELGRPYAELLWKHFKTSDNALLRQNILMAIASSIDPVVSTKMRDRILSPELRDNEILYIFDGQMSHEENRQALWEWTQENLWAVLERIPTWRKGQLPAEFDQFCSLEQANDIELFFTPVIDSLESGPRYLANSLETIRLCAQFSDLHRTQ